MDALWWWMGLFGCWLALRYVLTVSIIMRTRLGEVNGLVVSATEVPAYIQDLLTIPADQLHLMGFEDCGYIQIEPFVRNHPLVRWERILADATGCHFVTIGLRYPVNARDPFSISFYSWFADHHRLVTVDRSAHSIIDRLPNTTLRDNRIHNLEGQWRYHQQEFGIISQQRTPINLLDLAGFADNYFRFLHEYMEQGIINHVFIPEPNLDTVRLSFAAAVRTTDRMIRTAPKAQTLKEAISLPPQILNDNTKVLQAGSRIPFARRTKIWLFILSLVAFYVIAVSTMGWEFGLGLLAIIFIHELGHLLAMQIFGYRDTSMLMIPFLGGVAMGKNENATLSQKFWVYILGPLPGIIGGIILAVYSSHVSPFSSLHTFAITAIVINLLNLLPIYPLDGGKIINLLLQPYPYLGFAFKLICAIISICLGCLGQSIFLFLGIIIFISLPTDLRTAKAISRLKHQQAPVDLDRESWFEWASTYLDSNKETLIKPAQQKLFIDNLWEWKSDRHTSAWLRWGLSGIYAISLFGGIAGGLYGSFGNKLMGVSNMLVDGLQLKNMTPAQRKKYYQAKSRQQLADLSAKIAVNPNDIKAYNRRLAIHGLLEDRVGMLVDLDRLIVLEPNNQFHYLQRMGLYIKSREYLAALKDSDVLVKLVKKNSELTYIYTQRAELYNHLKDPSKAISELDRVINLSPDNLSVYLQRANFYLQIGKQVPAKRDLATAISLDSENYSDYEHRAKLRDKLGDKQGAITDRQKAKVLEAKADEL